MSDNDLAFQHGIHETKREAARRLGPQSTFWEISGKPGVPALKWEGKSDTEAQRTGNCTSIPNKMLRFILIDGKFRELVQEEEEEIQRPQTPVTPMTPSPSPSSPSEEDEMPDADPLSSPEKMEIFHSIYTPMEDDMTIPDSPLKTNPFVNVSAITMMMSDTSFVDAAATSSSFHQFVPFQECLST
jgi:hypothetical protein